MALDHSLTYRKFRLKNIPHIYRLKKIIRTVSSVNSQTDNYVDVGCSNGYITNILSSALNIKESVGLDYVEENLHKAAEKYPHILFQKLDLNHPIPQHIRTGFHLVTCFETLEHVGNIENAISNILQLSSKESHIVITVPIEIGFVGILKFLLKRLFYKGYTLQELGNVGTFQYLMSLVKGENIRKYRDSSKSGWGTHFGFDYRNIDQILNGEKISFTAQNSFTTRFYIIRRSTI